MDIRTRIGSQKYLKAADLQGQDINVTITSCEDEKLGQGQHTELKCVLYFRGKEKGLVLNSNLNDQFTVVTFATISGTFTNEPTPTFSGDSFYDWAVHYDLSERHQ